MGPQIITTNRLTLMVENTDHADRILSLYQRNKFQFEQYEPTRPDNFYTLEYHRTMLEREERAYHDGIFVRYYIYKNTNKNMIIGSVNFNFISSNCAEIGYKIDHFFQNQGIAYEACAAAINEVFRHYYINKIDARIHPNNTPSIKLATKLGFYPIRLERKSANILGKDEDLIRYSLVTSRIQ